MEEWFSRPRTLHSEGQWFLPPPPTRDDKQTRWAWYYATLLSWKSFQATAQVVEPRWNPADSQVEEIKLSMGRSWQQEFPEKRDLWRSSQRLPEVSRIALTSACTLGNYMRLEITSSKDKREQHLMLTQGKDNFMGHLSSILRVLFSNGK